MSDSDFKKELEVRHGLPGIISWSLSL
jgi:hypothetical protein